MKIFSCQHVPPGGTEGAFCLRPACGPDTQRRGEKEKPPCPPVKANMVSDPLAPSKPKPSLLLSEHVERQNEDTRSPEKNPACSIVTTRAAETDTSLSAAQAPGRHGAAALSLCATQRLPGLEECL